MHTNLDDSSVLTDGTGKNTELQFLKSDIQEMTVHVGCAYSLMNTPNK